MVFDFGTAPYLLVNHPVLHSISEWTLSNQLGNARQRDDAAAHARMERLFVLRVGADQNRRAARLSKNLTVAESATAQ